MVEVIVVEALRGLGQMGDPVRVVTQYWSLQGELLAEIETRALSATVDLVWCPSAVCAKLGSARGVYTILREGQASYRSALIAQRAVPGKPARNIASLHGTRAAWRRRR